MPGPLRDPSPGLRGRLRQRFGTVDGGQPPAEAAHPAPSVHPAEGDAVEPRQSPGADVRPGRLDPSAPTDDPPVP